MSKLSPYAPPKSPLLVVDARSELSGPIESVFTGRRLLMIALVIMAIGVAALLALGYAGSLVFAAPQAYFIISIFSIISMSSVFSLFVLGPIVAIVGAFRLAGALGHSSPASFILACLMVLPALNIVVIGWLAFRGNKALRASGFKAGVFGLRHA